MLVRYRLLQLDRGLWETALGHRAQRVDRLQVHIAKKNEKLWHDMKQKRQCFDHKLIVATEARRQRESYVLLPIPLYFQLQDPKVKKLKIISINTNMNVGMQFTLLSGLIPTVSSFNLESVGPRDT